MIRSFVYGVLGITSVIGLATIPMACQSGGIGDPCVPEDEYDGTFAGFTVKQEFIESRSFQCETRICLINHFQGRVSCPAGQSAPTACTPEDASACADGEECVESSTYAPECESDDQCSSGKCNADGKYCECADASTDCPSDGLTWSCAEGDSGGMQCKAYVCHTPNNCQTADDSSSATDKACCIPGTDIPVASSVCGQCDSGSHRDADNAVYCSCRCDVADGEERDPDFNYCECPSGFVCSQIRLNSGLTDEQLTGKYCVKEGSEYTGSETCNVAGHFDSEQCYGLASGSE